MSLVELNRAQKDMLARLKAGYDLTIAELAMLQVSMPDLISILEQMWATDDNGEVDEERRQKIRVGTLYLTHGDEPNSRLTLNLRFSLEPE